MSAGGLGRFAMYSFDFAAYGQVYAIVAVMGVRYSEHVNQSVQDGLFQP